jgi:hypothetical protein
MTEFFYRETEGTSRRPMGPYETADEARKAARYKGLLKIEVLKKERAGSAFEPVDAQANAPKSAAAPGSPNRPNYR